MHRALFNILLLCRSTGQLRFTSVGKDLSAPACSLSTHLMVVCERRKPVGERLQQQRGQFVIHNNLLNNNRINLSQLIWSLNGNFDCINFAGYSIITMAMMKARNPKGLFSFVHSCLSMVVGSTRKWIQMLNAWLRWYMRCYKTGGG